MPSLLDASRSLPEFAELDLQGKVLPEGVGPGDIKAFQVLYREHCEVGLQMSEGLGGLALSANGLPRAPRPMMALAISHCKFLTLQAIVDVMVNLQFTLVETLWKTFWRYNLSQPNEAPPLAV